ncbi:MAG: response regulator, partial [Acidobacteria bacterium]|nr:response regulator [Acidobacteriota bacterium]
MSTATQTILLVDDDKHLVVGASAVLRRAGFDVITAHSGVEGLEKARAAQPHLILCDVMMPPPDGFELRRRLSWASETAGIPFVF